MALKAQRINARPEAGKSDYQIKSPIFNEAEINKLTFNDVAFLTTRLGLSDIRELQTVYIRYDYQYELNVYRYTLAWTLFTRGLLYEKDELIKLLQPNITDLPYQLIVNCPSQMVLALSLAYRQGFQSYYLNNWGSLIATYLKLLAQYQSVWTKYFNEIPIDLVDQILVQNIDHLQEVYSFLTDTIVQKQEIGTGQLYWQLLENMIQWIKRNFYFLLDVQIPIVIRNRMLQYILEYNWEREPKIRAKIQADLKGIEPTYQGKVVHHKLVMEDIIWAHWCIWRKDSYTAETRTKIITLWRSINIDVKCYPLLSQIPEGPQNITNL